MRRLRQRREPAHLAAIRTALRHHIAVAPWLRGNPLDRVIAVGRLLAVWQELSFGVAAAAHILDQERVAMPIPGGDQPAEVGAVSVVWRGAQDGRMRPL